MRVHIKGRGVCLLLFFIILSLAVNAQKHECYEINTEECSQVDVTGNMIMTESLSAYTPSSIILANAEILSSSNNAIVQVGPFASPEVILTVSRAIIPGWDSNTRFTAGDISLDSIHNKSGGPIVFGQNTLIAAPLDVFGQADLGLVPFLNNPGDIIIIHETLWDVKNLTVQDIVTAYGAYFKSLNVQGAFYPNQYVYATGNLEGDTSVVANNLVGPLNLRRTCDGRSNNFRAEDGFTIRFANGDKCASGSYCEVAGDCLSGVCNGEVCS